VRVGPCVRQAVPKPPGASIFDFIDFDEAVHASGHLKCLKSFHRSSVRSVQSVMWLKKCIYY
jgi:hypothetical protein